MRETQEQEVYSDLEYHWFCRAAKPVSKDNPAVTLLLDLDETILLLVVNNHFKDIRRTCHKFSKLINSPLPPFLCYSDPNVFSTIKAFCDKGHKLIVVTTAIYDYSNVQKIFKEMGDLTLTKDQYYNRTDMFAKNPDLDKNQHYFTLKPVFIDRICQQFQPDVMLFDDQISNRPKNCLFRLADPTKPFPFPKAQRLEAMYQNQQDFYHRSTQIKNQQKEAFYFAVKQARDKIEKEATIIKFTELLTLIRCVNKEHIKYFFIITKRDIAKKLLADSGLSHEQVLSLYSMEQEINHDTQLWRYLFSIQSFAECIKSLYDDTPAFKQTWQKWANSFELQVLLSFYHDHRYDDGFAYNIDWEIILESNQPIKTMARIALLNALEIELRSITDDESYITLTRQKEIFEKHLTNTLSILPSTSDIEHILQKPIICKSTCGFFSKKTAVIKQLSIETKKYIDIAKALEILRENTRPSSHHCLSLFIG